MFAPPGVDSDSSGEEDDSPPTAPPPAPKPGLFKTLFTPTHKLNEQQAKEDVKNLTPIQSAEELTPRTPTPPKGKKVRIRLEGEEHPDKVDLIESPVSQSPDSPVSPAESESMEEIHTGALSPIHSGKRPEEVAGEVLVLLQKILAESASRPPTPPSPFGATLTPFLDQQAQGAAANALGVVQTPHASPGHISQAQDGKKPSKLAKWTKLAMQVANASSSNENSPTASGNTVPPYTGPTDPNTPQLATAPPAQASHYPPDQQYQAPPPSSSAYPPFSGHPASYGHMPGDQAPAPAGWLPPQQGQGHQTPLHPSQYSASVAQQHYPPSSQALGQYAGYIGYGSPYPQGAAEDYYAGNVYASQPYPHHVLGDQAYPASAPPQQAAFTDTNKPNRYTDYPSRWRPGEMHWTPPTDGARSNNANRSVDQPAQAPQREPYLRKPPPRRRAPPASAAPPPLHVGSQPRGPSSDPSEYHPVTAPLPVHALSSAPPWQPQQPPFPQYAGYYPPPPIAPWHFYPPWAFPPYPPYSPLSPNTQHHPPESPHASSSSPATDSSHHDASSAPEGSPPITRRRRPAVAEPFMTFPTPEHYVRRAKDSPVARREPDIQPHLQGSAKNASPTSSSSAYSDSSESDDSPYSGIMTASPTSSTSPPISPRIVRQGADGTFHSVEPYPEAQALLSPLTRSRGPPPDYRSNDEALSPSDMVATPRKVRKEDMSPEKQREYEAVLKRQEEKRKRQTEEKARVKAAEGSLSPKEVEIAIEIAAEARGAVERGQESVPAPDKPNPKSKEETRKGEEDEDDRVKRQKERVMAKLKKGEISKDEAKAMLKQLDAPAAKNAATRSSAEADKATGTATAVAGASVGGTITPVGRGFTEIEKKLDETKYRIKRLKAKVVDGKMSKDDARAELEKLTERQKKLLLELPGPSSPAAEKSVRETTKRRPREDEEIAPARALLGPVDDEAVIEGKGKGKESADPPAAAPSFTKSAVELKTIATTPNPDAAAKEERSASARGEDLARVQLELKERMKRIKQRVNDGKMDKDEARKELARLEQKRSKLELAGGEARKPRSLDDVPTNNPGGEVKSKDPTGLAQQSVKASLPAKEARKTEGIATEADSEAIRDAKQQADELKARMKRIQAKVVEGKMSEAEGETELKRLQAKREKFKGVLGGSRRAEPNDDRGSALASPKIANGPESKLGATGSTSPPLVIGPISTPQSASAGVQAVSADSKPPQFPSDTSGNGVRAPPSTGFAATEEKSEEIASRMKRVQAKIVEGKLDKAVGKVELARLAKKQKQLHVASKTPRAAAVGSTPDCSPGAKSPLKASVEDAQEEAPEEMASTEEPAHRPDRADAVSSKLADIRMKMQRLKVRTADGRLSAEAAKMEMAKLKQEEHELENIRPREDKSGDNIDDFGRAASTVEAAAQDANMEAEGKLAEVRTRMQRVKVKVAQGRMSKEDGKVEMAKLMSKKKEYEVAASRGESSLSTSPDKSLQAEQVPGDPHGTTKAGHQLVEIRARMQRVKAKVSEGEMSAEDGNVEIARLKQKEREYEAAGVQAVAKTLRGPQGAVDTPDDTMILREESKKKVAEVRARMQRVKATVADGQISKEEAKVEMDRLRRKEEALEAMMAKEKSTTASNSERHHDFQPSKTPTATTPLSEGSKSSAVSGITLPEVDEQLYRIKRKLKDGTLDAEKAKMKLAELGALRQKFERSAAPPYDQHSNAEGHVRTQEQVQLGLAIQEQLTKVKQQIKEGQMDPTEGNAALAKLAEKLKTVGESPTDRALSSNSAPVPPPSESQTERVKDTTGDLDAQRRSLERKLEQNKRQLVQLQKKVVSATADDRAPIEKALKKLETERKGLKMELSALSTRITSPRVLNRSTGTGITSPHTRPTGSASLGATTDPQEELDPDILREILAYDLAGTAPPRSSPLNLKESSAAPFHEGEGIRQSTGEASNIRKTTTSSPPHISGSYPTIARTRDVPLDQTAVGAGATPSRSAFSPQAPVELAPIKARPFDDSEIQTMSGDLPGDLLHPEFVTGTNQVSQGLSDSRAGGSHQQRSAALAVDSPLAGHVRDATWSTCLVSLAECINLANHLLAQLAAKHEARDVRDGTGPSLFERLIPRLLTAVLLQQDLDGVLKRIFGDESARPIHDFMRHLHQVKGYLSDIDIASLTSDFGSRDGKCLDDYCVGCSVTALTAGDTHGVLAITDHLLRLSQYLSPDMMSSLRGLLHEWKEDGLTLHNILQTIRFVKNDLMISPARAEYAAERVEGGSKANLLHQLLELLDTEVELAKHKTAKHTHRHSHRLSLPPVEPAQTTRPQPASPPQESLHGVRKRLSSMIHTLRAPASPPAHASAPATAPLNISSRTNSPAAAPTRHRRSSSASASATETHQHHHHSPASHGLTILTKSLSPTSKRRVAHHLLRPSEVVHEEHHTPHSAPHLHLPAATADFLEASLRSTTPAIGPQRSARPVERGVDEGRAHHIPESVVVRPPGPAYAPGSEHHIHRPRAGSADSTYSVNSVDTEGTIDSDDEARELLAQADSGPQAVHHAFELPSPDVSEPDADQVRRAKEVLMVKDKR